MSEIDVAAVDIEDVNDDSKEGDASVEEGSRRRVTENNGGSKELQRDRWMGLLSAAEAQYLHIFCHQKVWESFTWMIIEHLSILCLQSKGGMYFFVCTYSCCCSVPPCIGSGKESLDDCTFPSL